MGSVSHRDAASISKEIRKKSNALRFNTQAQNADSSMQPSYHKRMQDYAYDHETASAQISAKKNMTALNRDALSQLRNSHKNLGDSKSNNSGTDKVGLSVRDSGRLEDLIQDFNIRKKNHRINGVMLAPLDHAPVDIKPHTNKALSQNRPSIPLSTRPSELDKINPQDLSSKAIISTHSISPMGKGVKTELYNPLPVNCGLQMPPPLAPGAYGRKLEPLSTLNIVEK